MLNTKPIEAIAKICPDTLRFYMTERGYKSMGWVIGQGMESIQTCHSDNQGYTVQIVYRRLGSQEVFKCVRVESEN